MNKKGVSPVIATVLLISIVVVVGLIIFVWASNFFGEVGQKFGKSAEQVCGEINLRPEMTNSQLSVINNGNVPVYSLNAYKTKAGSIEIQNLDKINLVQGDVGNWELGEGYDKIELMPVILVQVGKSQEPFSCEKIKIDVPLVA